MKITDRDIWDEQNMIVVKLLIEGWKLFSPIQNHIEFLHDKRLPRDIRLNIMNLYFLLIDSWKIK